MEGRGSADNTAEEKHNAGFVPFRLNAKGSSPAVQAKAILDEVKRQYEAGAARIGITCLVSHEQSKAIRDADNQAPWATLSGGAGNQAAVMKEVGQLLSTDAYRSLQSVFRILPITTHRQGAEHDFGKLPNNFIEPDITNINHFLIENDAVALGWQNDTSKSRNGYSTADVDANGKPLKHALRQDQVGMIQQALQRLAAANLPQLPALSAKANGQEEQREKENAYYEAVAEAFRLDFGKICDTKFVLLGEDSVSPNVVVGVPDWEKESGQYVVSGNASRKVVIDWNNDTKKATLLSDHPKMKDYQTLLDFYGQQGISRLSVDFGSPKVYDPKTAMEVVKRAIYQYNEMGKPVWQKDANSKIMKDPVTGHKMHKWKEPPQAFKLGPNIMQAINARTAKRNGRTGKLRAKLAKAFGLKSSTDTLDANYGYNYEADPRHPKDVQLLKIAELSQRRHGYWLDNKNINLPENTVTDSNAVAPPQPPGGQPEPVAQQAFTVPKAPLPPAQQAVESQVKMPEEQHAVQLARDAESVEMPATGTTPEGRIMAAAKQVAENVDKLLKNNPSIPSDGTESQQHDKTQADARAQMAAQVEESYTSLDKLQHNEDMKGLTVDDIEKVKKFGQEIDNDADIILPKDKNTLKQALSEYVDKVSKTADPDEQKRIAEATLETLNKLVLDKKAKAKVTEFVEEFSRSLEAKHQNTHTLGNK